MKTYYKKVITVLCIILATSCLSKNTENDWQKDNLYGRVKSFTEISYEATVRFGNIEKDGPKKIRMVGGGDFKKIYDEKGFVKEVQRYNTSGKMTSESLNTYNEKGILVETNHYNIFKELVAKDIYEYDSKDNLIEKKHFDKQNSDENRTWVYKYNEKGYQEEVINYNDNGKFNLKTTMQYDKKGRRVEESVYFTSNSLDIKRFFLYNEKGNVIEIITDIQRNNDISKQINLYEYDAQGNWIKKIEFFYDMPRYIIERQYQYFE